MAARTAGERGQLPQSVDLRAAQVVAPAERVPVSEAARKALHQVAHIDGLEFRIGAGEKNQRQPARQGGKHVDESVVRTEHDRWPEHGHRKIFLRGEHPRLALALGAQVLTRAVSAGIERAHVQQARHVRVYAGLDDAPRQLDVRPRELRAERLAAPALQNACQVDNGVGATHQLRQRMRIHHIGLDHLDRRQQQQMPATGGPARGDQHRMAIG